MAGLKNLIRLHEWTVDERRRELGVHLRLLSELDQSVADLEAELQREQALAGSGADGMNITFMAYFEQVQKRRKRLQARIRQQEQEIQDARDILGRAYMELKKYEVAQEVRDRKEALEEARREQEALDDVGLQLYRRRQAG